MLSIFLLIPLSLMLFVVAIWAVRYAVKSNQFEDLDNASQRIILDDRQERRQVLHSHQSQQTMASNDTKDSSVSNDISPNSSTANNIDDVSEKDT